MDDIEAVDADARTAGDQLRSAREAAGQSVADIAARTRIPQRHLEAIERDDFKALPSPTYSVGFARAFARAVGADEVRIAATVRRQLESSGRDRQEYQAFQPADPARVPPRYLAWTAAIVAVLILGGYALWRSTAGGSADAPVAAEVAAPTPTPQPPAAAAAPPAPASGPVILAATDAVWIKVTDASGQSLVQRELKAGETYQVPAEAQEPKLTFSRPEALTVTVGGAAIPPLGPPARLVKNALLTPDALRARIATAAAPLPARP